MYILFMYYNLDMVVKRIFKEEVMGFIMNTNSWLAGGGWSKSGVCSGRELNELDLIDCNFERADSPGCHP